MTERAHSELEKKVENNEKAFIGLAKDFHYMAENQDKILGRFDKLEDKIEKMFKTISDTFIPAERFYSRIAEMQQEIDGLNKFRDRAEKTLFKFVFWVVVTAGGVILAAFVTAWVIFKSGW